MENEPLGIDGSTLQMLFAEAFQKKGIEVVHGKPTMDEARLIKTQDEIELMRITCANSEKAFAAIVDAIRPGVRECDLVGIGIKALYEEGDDHTEDLVCCSGYNTNPYGWSFSDKPIRPGRSDLHRRGRRFVPGIQVVRLSHILLREGDTGAEGPLRRVPRHALRGHERGESTGPPTTTSSRNGRTRRRYWGYDDWNEVAAYAIGHGLGLTLHDRPLITPIKKLAGYPPTTLQAGMVLALETYAGHKGGEDGVRLEENILVTEDGYELLTRWPIEELMECWLPYR